MADYPHTPLGPAPVPYSYNETSHYPPTSMAPGARYAGARTPSPTPSEVEALSGNLLDVKKYLNWRFWARRDWIVYYIIGAVILVLTILISVFDKQIVNWLTPAGRWMKNLPFGWLIPIAILFVLSFPPLFGHEIVAILVGVIWGLGIGFAIVAAGTFLGEVGNFYAFKYCCRARGEKMEKTNINYGCLARVVREGGFKIALIIRLSVIPGHFSTAVFSTCGMNIFVFALAAFFSLPKQLITVYIGVILEESGAGVTTTRDRVISDSVLAVTVLITLGAGYYIYQELNRVKPAVIYERRKARQVKMGNPTYGMDNTSSTTLFPRDSESDLPLSVMPQRPAQYAFTQSGYAGYGGYNPSHAQGRYGDVVDPEERKSTNAVDWETRGPRVDDMRGAKWASGSKAGHASDEEDESEESTIETSTSDPALPPALPPPPQSPYRQPAAASTTTPSSDPLPNPFGERTPEAYSGHRFQLSDPPVVQHTPLPSDSSYAYPPSLPTHSAQPTDASYDSQSPLVPHGHAMQPTDSTTATFQTGAGHYGEPTDASYYTAAGPLSREPSYEPPQGPPATFSPTQGPSQYPGH